MSNHTFFLLLGTLSSLGALLLVFHLIQPKLHIQSLGQILRYLTFFAYAATIAYAASELIHEDIDRDMRHVLYLLCTVLLIVTVIVSILETRKNGKH